jgi:hypothetical protein
MRQSGRKDAGWTDGRGVPREEPCSPLRWPAAGLSGPPCRPRRNRRRRAASRVVAGRARRASGPRRLGGRALSLSTVGRRFVPRALQAGRCTLPLLVPRQLGATCAPKFWSLTRWRGAISAVKAAFATGPAPLSEGRSHAAVRRANCTRSRPGPETSTCSVRNSKSRAYIAGRTDMVAACVPRSLPSRRF